MRCVLAPNLHFLVTQATPSFHPEVTGGGPLKPLHVSDALRTDASAEAAQDLGWNQKLLTEQGCGSNREAEQGGWHKDRTAGRGQGLSTEQPGAQGLLQGQQGPRKVQTRGREVVATSVRREERLSKGCWSGRGWAVASLAPGGARHTAGTLGPAGGPHTAGPGLGHRPGALTELLAASVPAGCFCDEAGARNRLLGAPVT